MFNHQPDDYICPFCLIAAGREHPQSELIESRRSDIVFQTATVTALISSHWWPHNAGHVLIVPNEHYENIYDLPQHLTTDIHHLAQKIAIALKIQYGCHGVSTRQHNEPAGDQEVWHYHLHVFPRYPDDNLYRSNKRRTTPAERAPYAAKLRAYFMDFVVDQYL